MSRLAASVGGGEVGPGPASVVSTAALQMAASRWLYDVAAAAGDARGMGEASRLADSSRQNLLAAHELTAKEAAAVRAKPKTYAEMMAGMPRAVVPLNKPLPPRKADDDR